MKAMIKCFSWLLLCILVARPVAGQVLWYYVTPNIATRAIAVLRVNGTGPVVGTVQFSQPNVYGPVTVTGSAGGLASSTTHRAMVQQLGDISNGCVREGVGGIYNPPQVTNPWGNPGRPVVGDLGVVQSNQDGIGQFILTSSTIGLNGAYNVIGRAVAIHELAGQPGGNAFVNVGPIVACGVIGLAAET